MKRRAIVLGGFAAGMALALVAPTQAQDAGQSLPPTLGQPPAPPSQNQQPRLRVLMSPSVASPMLLLPGTGAGNGGGLTSGGMGSDQPSSQSGSENLYPKSAVQGTPSSAQASNPEGDYSKYNPRPFLTTMLELRLTANTCEQYLPTSPDEVTSGIEGFFTGLKRPSPTGTLKDLGRSLDMLVRSQAASVCQDRMNKALANYRDEARLYDDKKPKTWPAAPVIKSTNWCSTPNCIEVK